MMKKLAVILFVLSVGLLAVAQDAPKAELFGGYQYTNVDFGSGVDRQNFNGWNVDLALHAKPNFSLVADFGAAYKSETVGGVTAKARIYPILFGPRDSGGSGKVTPFAEALFGFSHITGSFTDVGSDSVNKFSMAFGGGVDVNASKNIAVRLAK